mmetsp:Transcript_18858/g.21846  ORF Transcript_18858/g.21846 Transcript_18858/m.21846 type:complete len:114 (-) Transcript_18858:141-482(-)
MTNFIADAMEKILSEEEKGVRIGSLFERTGCLIELKNRQLLDQEKDGRAIHSDDKIKPQGLSGKYTVPVQEADQEVTTVDVPIIIPDEEVLQPASIDQLIEEVDNIFNDLLVN